MAATPQFLSERPESPARAVPVPPFAPVDALAALLDSLRLTNAVFGRSELSAPWGIALAQGAHMPFHAVLAGRCWLTGTGLEKPLLLEEGDLILLPHGTAHELRDQPHSPTLPIEAVLGTGACAAMAAVRHGGGGEASVVVCGAFLFAPSPAPHPLLSALPRVLHVRAAERAGQPWLESTLKFVACELASGRAGAQAVVNRLADVLFVQVLRHHMAHLPACSQSWLRGLRDAHVGRALNLLHADPAHPWTVLELAARVGLSRSLFAERFTALVGEPPLAYLTRWRLWQAADLLARTDASVAEIAAQVGYGSDAALGKAFQRQWGMGPGRWRRERDRTQWAWDFA